MDLKFETSRAELYSSQSQRVRRLSERWAERNMYCINCGEQGMEQFANNAPVADFYCSACNEEYEIKSQKGAFQGRIVNGAYRTMLERLNANNNPNLMLLNYDLPSLSVTNLIVVPKHFFIADIIQRRPPLSEKARRAGWVGCNILLGSVPESGKIYVIRDRAVQPKSVVLANWQQTAFLRRQQDQNARRWLLTVLRYIEHLGKREFALSELYRFESDIQRQFPKNQHIKAKIRQQLQVLRDNGYLTFSGRGNYAVVAT